MRWQRNMFQTKEQESLSKFKKTEILSRTFADNNAMKLDINYKKNLQNPQTQGG